MPVILCEAAMGFVSSPREAAACVAKITHVTVLTAHPKSAYIVKVDAFGSAFKCATGDILQGGQHRWSEGRETPFPP